MSEVHPVQAYAVIEVSKLVTLRAYEVYCHIHGPQSALVQNGCRGGFDNGELIAFLYARSFPREQWRERAEEAFLMMKVRRP